PLHLHQKRECIPALTAAETFVKPLRRRNRKRRSLLLVERTAAHPIRALLLQRRVRLDYPHQIGSVLEIIDEVLFVEHGLKKFRLRLSFHADLWLTTRECDLGGVLVL